MPTYSRRNKKTRALVALGDAIRRSRTAIGLSQEELAFHAKLDRSYVGSIERGESNLTVLNLANIAAVMKRTASQLLEDAGL